MSRPDNRPTMSELGLFGYKSTSSYTLSVCPQCKESFRRYSGEVEFIYKGLKFCTYPCKAQYRREHPTVEYKQLEIKKGGTKRAK